MSVNIYDSTTDTLHKVAGLVDDTDLKQDIEDIQAVIPSGASAENPLIADDRIIRLAVGNRNLSTIQSDIQTIVEGLAVGYYPVHFSIYMLHDSTYLADGWGVVTGTVHKHTTGIYNIDLIISQSSQHIETIFIKDSSYSAGSWTSKKILTTSDLTSTVTSGSNAVITSGGIYTTFQGRDATINTSFPNYRSGFCKYVSIGAFIVGSGRIQVSEDTTSSAEIVSGLPSNSTIIPVLIYNSTNDADMGYARYEAGKIYASSLKAGHNRFSFCGLVINA